MRMQVSQGSLLTPEEQARGEQNVLLLPLWNRIHRDQNLVSGRQYRNHTATWYGAVNYAYFNLEHRAQSWSRELGIMADQLGQQVGYPAGYFNCLLANAYTRKGLAPHADNEAIFRQPDGTIGAVATISLGGATMVTITRNDGSEAPVSFKIRHGEWYLMPEGHFQDQYQHAVSASSQPRISLTFRHIHP